MIEIIEQHRQELDEICRSRDVKTLEIFGSASEGGWSPERSDIDFLVEFRIADHATIFHSYFDLLFDLEKLFNRKVDLVMPRAIRNPYFLDQVNKSRRVIYAA